MSVCFYGCITIDGFLADKNHNVDWLYETGTIEETGYEEFYKKIDITVMGKKTFDEVSKFPNAHSMYPTSENYVFTHSKKLDIDNYIPISCDVVKFIENFDKDKNIWIIGGSKILTPLLDNNLVEKMIIQIAPVLLGEGIPLFTQKEMLRRFILEKINRYGQFVELIYKR
ncbi:dihydrofolate reductase family protein [Anaerosphaera multitolerans]|uniref:Dihydrofolate reductase n=1 Tax=Anaerosphaera multitolerans TaxID=2487351 RepID=A0A437S472_9FIRM|nr:dihydrofolate reductase family protein [Anaerosphaera multitolerans]RVU53813.1 dihydrofolate reductase [Anaerosphaera multitolerans]